MRLSKHSQLKFGLLLFTGALIAFILCIQCVRTYWYTESVLVPQQAEREAERQSGVLTLAARSAGISDPNALGPVIQRVLDADAARILWVRVWDPQGRVIAQGGHPYGTAKIPARWWESMERHEIRAVPVDTPQARAFVTMLPFRLQHSPRFSPHDASPRSYSDPPQLRAGPDNGHPPAYILELAISYSAVADAFAGLRQNLIIGVIASIALLLSVAVIALRARHYFRGKYLENEMQLARRVQSHLQPDPNKVLSQVEFAAAAAAADHVGGDFHDVFETDTGEIVIVLGDVSGKGVPAALLVSVLQGAIRSSTAAQHELACERINRMLCERTACERFATLFWGVFDPARRTLRYVNAGHAAPLFIRPAHGEPKAQITYLEEGGPVLGVIPAARYSAGIVTVEANDRLILYSDGISEAAGRNDEEFGDGRILHLVSHHADATPAELCHLVMNQVTGFASAAIPQDDRTLLIVRFPPRGSNLSAQALEAEAAA